MAKKRLSFRFDPELYREFKSLARGSGLKVTEALEKFMSASVANGAVVFPDSTAAVEAVEREVRILLSWLHQGVSHYCPGSEDDAKINVAGRLLTLLPHVKGPQLKTELEEALEKF